VRVGDGYGTVTELLNAVSVTKLIRRNPEDMTLAAKYYIDMLKSIHAIEVEDGKVPDMKETALDWADFVSRHIPEDQGKKLRALIEAVPKKNTMMHGDYHTNNIMVQNGEPLLIDMDTLCMGHPVFELGSMFNAFVGYSELNHQNIIDFFGYDFETAGKFWNMALKMYLDTDDDKVCQSVAEKAMVIGYTRMLRRAVRRPNEADSPAKIERCKEMLAELLSKVDTLVF
ncbi:MAG: phosphotransferase, partial [Clostridia bacterium]|nr:phosphotransferase [Clostridia bacterium]